MLPELRKALIALDDREAQPHAVHDRVLSGSRSDRIRLEVARGDEDVRVDWRKRVPATVVIVIPAERQRGEVR